VKGKILSLLKSMAKFSGVLENYNQNNKEKKKNKYKHHRRKNYPKKIFVIETCKTSDKSQN
jgi:hypothetical protein